VANTERRTRALCAGLVVDERTDVDRDGLREVVRRTKRLWEDRVFFSTSGRRPLPGSGDQFLCGDKSPIFDEDGCIGGEDGLCD
jgi:hypothetical protein